MARRNYTDWTREQLVEELNKVKKRKKFGLVWEDKPEDVVEQCKKELPILEEAIERKIICNPELPDNILIEGDNYHALSVLNYTHKGKIDLIYADPPYNTGAKDWKYNNNFVDSNDLYRHSKWISLMEKRLKLAKSLLKKDGILIVTIDDNELFHLGCILEEIYYSYEIFIITIEHNRRGRRGKNFAKTNEYALFLIPKGMDLIIEEKSENKLGGETRNLRRTGSGSRRSDRPRKFYPIWVNKNTLEIVSAGDPLPLDAEWKIEDKDDLITIYPIDPEGREKNWHYGVERTRECIKRGELEARVRDYGIQVYYTLREKDSKKYKTVWSGPKFDASTYGSVLLEKVMGEPGKFDYPKSLYAVLECLIATVGNKKDAVILDFFAGSGTTGHAVSLLNKQDDGRRKFILCTNNENNIAEEVTYPRIKKVIEGVDRLPELTGFPSNLRYYRTGFVPAKLTDKNKLFLVSKSTEMLCLKEECHEIIKEDNHFKLFRNGRNKYLGIIYNDEGIDDFKSEIKKLDKKVNTYVFSLDDSAREEEFEDIIDLVDLKPIPEVILNVYRRIFK